MLTDADLEELEERAQRLAERWADGSFDNLGNSWYGRWMNRETLTDPAREKRICLNLGRLIAEVRRLREQNQTLEAACSRKDGWIWRMYACIAGVEHFTMDEIKAISDEDGKR